MATTNPAMRFTGGVQITSGYLTVNGQSVRINPSDNGYFSFLNMNTTAGGFEIEEYGLTRGTLAAAGTVEIDLFDGTLTNLFGQSVVFNTLKFASIFIAGSSYLIPGTTGKLRVGAAAADGNGLWFGAVANTQTIYPAGVPFLQGDPTGVTVDATHKKVKLENTHATDAVYYIAVFGGMI